MLRRQCGNQLRAQRARETSKLIAIIDDDEAMQDSLRDLMEAAGLVARCFGSAEEFLESGFHRQAACMIFDILMLKMSGLQLHSNGIFRVFIAVSYIIGAAPPSDEPRLNRFPTLAPSFSTSGWAARKGYAFSPAVPHPDLIARVAEKAREPATELVVSTAIPKTP
jgi:hypothetical protein